MLKAEMFSERSSRKLSPIKSKSRVLVMASGGGTTFEAIVEYERSNEVSYETVALVSNNKNAGALGKADSLGVSSFFIPYGRSNSQKFFDDALVVAEKFSVDVIVLAGFLLLIREPILSRYSGKILNTHPSLLPHFGGKGMYGDRVHQAVIQSGHKESGVTIHLVNENYDEGQVIGQLKVPVLDGDDYQSLSEKVRAEEKKLYPLVLDQFCRQ